MKFHFQFSVCYVSPTELDRFLNDEFEAFIEDLKLSAVTSDFDDEIEPQGLYFCFTFISIFLSLIFTPILFLV